VILAAACGSFAAEIGPSTTVVEWDRGQITVSDLTQWWERIKPDERPQVSTAEEKAGFLQSMISARLMLDEAESLGIHKDPGVMMWLARSRTSRLKEALEAQALKGRVAVEESEVERFYQRRLTQIEARHIIVPSLEQAEALLDSLRAGVPFEDLAHRHSTCASGERGGFLGDAVRWGDFSDRWSEQAFRLEPGEVSPPFMVEGGYAFIKVDGKTLVEPETPQAERYAIWRNLEKQKIFEETVAFRDSLRLGYDVDVDIGAVVALCAGYAEAIAALGETREVIDVDVEPALMDSEWDRPLVTYKGGSFSNHEVVDMILAQPYPTRPTLDDPDDMSNFLRRQLVDTLEVMEAEKRRLDELPEVAGPLQKIRQRKLIQRFYWHITHGVDVPEDVLRSHFETNRAAYTLEAGHTLSKIVVQSRASADSIMGLLESGASFEDIARRRSVDPFYAPKGGDMGFLPEGKDPEFDGFLSTMDIGEMKEFRSLEGFVILWLRERRERMLPSFDEALPMMEQTLRPAYRDQILNEWLAEEYERRGVKVHEDVLEQVALGA
jgi:peptidyl-prolyl cis-trans isomerase C